MLQNTENNYMKIRKNIRKKQDYNENAALIKMFQSGGKQMM